MILKSFTDGLFNGAVFTDENGRRIYFPHSMFGAGYVIPDETTDARLRAAHRKAMVGTFWLIILFSGFAPFASGFELMPFWAFAAIFIAVLIPFAYITRKILNASVAGLEVVENRPGVGETFQVQSRAMPRWFWIFETIFCALMVAGGVFMILDASTPTDIAAGAAVTLLFTGLLGWAAYGLKNNVCNHA